MRLWNQGIPATAANKHVKMSEMIYEMKRGK